MYARRLAIGLSTLAALAFVAGTATAGDTIRLSLPSGESAPTINLKATPADLAADTVATRFGRGGFGGFRGGFRGGFVGHRVGFGGFRGGFGGGYRGFYRPYYSSYYYRTPYYYGTPYIYPYYSSYGYYSPIGLSATASISTQTTVLRPAAASGYERPLPMPEEDQPRLAPSEPGTFPYDGGPQRQIPMPAVGEMPVSYPGQNKPAIVEDIVVKLPAKSSGKWTYPAYGEKPSR
jgi:hypothetical protein